MKILLEGTIVLRRVMDSFKYLRDTADLALGQDFMGQFLTFPYGQLPQAFMHAR
jgi:hypothetical protein